MSENQITIECNCLNCGDHATNKLHSIDNESITFVCSKCGVMNSIPRDAVYLSSFTPQGMVKDVPPTASVEIVPTVDPNVPVIDLSGIKYPESPPISACTSSKDKEPNV